MRLIRKDDFIEGLVFLRLLGFRKILSKLHILPARRTANKFDDGNIQKINANWWVIPAVKERLNEKITGDKNRSYEDYTSQKYFADRSPQQMLSLGSGVCSHEIIFAELNPNLHVTCVDISDSSLQIGRKNAQRLGLANIEFICTDVNTWNWETKQFDIILFHSSLHHFKNIAGLMNQVKDSLNKGGLMILYEFVGPSRLAWTSSQIKSSNHFIKKIPKRYRSFPVKVMTKKSVSGPGLIRMLIMDPSEAVESHLIRPEINKRFEAIEEKDLGGNLLTLIFKGIAHHFCDKENLETNQILEKAFAEEDLFLKNHTSDLLFGVYKAIGDQ